MLAIVLWSAVALLVVVGLAVYIILTCLEDAWHPPRTLYEDSGKSVTTTE